MEGFLIRTLVSAGLLYAMSRMIDGIELRGAVSAILAAVVLGLVNSVVGPLLTLLALPVVILTLGLALLAINAVTLMITAALVPGFSVRGFGSALIGSVVLALLHLVVGLIFG